MRYIYSLAIAFYTLLVCIASAFNKKAARMVRGRRESFRKITDAFKQDDRIFWFHCASLGEFEQGRPVIEKIKNEQNDIKILLTFYSPSGYEIRHNYEKADCVVYLPADTIRNSHRLIKMVKPEKAVFVKYEFWYNYLRVLLKNEIPVYLISGNFRPTQPFFRFYGKYFKNIISRFTRLFVQDIHSGKLLEAHNINNYTVSGDTRFDRVVAITESADKISGIEEFKTGSRLIVAGSTWTPEEEMIADYLNTEPEDIKLIIAPHNIGDINIERIERMLNSPSVRYSQTKGRIPAETKVIIIDSIGLLSSMYRYADIALIGGGFGKGIHNIIEAATWGVPVLFGPRYSKFREAVDLIKLGGARVFHNYEDLVDSINELFNTPGLLNEAGGISRAYVHKNLGATDMISEALLT